MVNTQYNQKKKHISYLDRNMYLDSITVAENRVEWAGIMILAQKGKAHSIVQIWV